jgi:TM2 domain-containing membrane protein YozV
MLELLIVTLQFLIMAAIVGFVVGVGVLFSREQPKVAQFMAQRPVLGWTAAFVVGGTVCWLFFILLAFITLILNVVLGPH